MSVLGVQARWTRRVKTNSAKRRGERAYGWRLTADDSAMPMQDSRSRIADLRLHEGQGREGVAGRRRAYGQRVEANAALLMDHFSTSGHASAGDGCPLRDADERTEGFVHRVLGRKRLGNIRTEQDQIGPGSVGIRVLATDAGTEFAAAIVGAHLFRPILLHKSSFPRASWGAR